MALEATRCKVCGLDPRTVRPPDAGAALRSYPRRYRRLLVRLDDEEGAGVVTRRPGPGQWSAVEHAAHVVDVIDAVGEAVERVRVHDQPSITLDVPPPRQAPVDELLLRLSLVCERLASMVDTIKGNDWKRSGRLPGGEQATALDMVRHAVHVGAHHRREIERVMATVR